jgi:hypothetical protein
MAWEAGLPNAWISESGVLKWSDLEAFAALVAAAEREACAKLCEDEKINATHYSAPTQSNWLAKKIRAR